MNYSTVPPNVKSLEQRLINLEGARDLAVRRRTSMALVVVAQMLPEGAIKGGSAMALRYGRNTRFTRDVDAARVHELSRFREEFEEALAHGWEDFTGRLIETDPPSPVGVPPGYVMQPFEIKLSYRSKSWCTVTFELGHNEIGDADEPELQLADDLADLFTALGLPRPSPVPVMRIDHQVAQKLHALTSVDSDRARDLVDLQLLARDGGLDLAQTARTCRRLFTYRRQQPWPPSVTPGPDWDTLYVHAADGLEVAGRLNAAVAWCEEFIQALDEA